uniref:Uncharacterized protein n=1 Tax=Heterorhabditis bacteriophora TaxID=37862 RepID=A0A1I7X140_HETBA
MGEEEISATTSELSTYLVAGGDNRSLASPSSPIDSALLGYVAALPRQFNNTTQKPQP